MERNKDGEDQLEKPALGPDTEDMSTESQENVEMGRQNDNPLSSERVLTDSKGIGLLANVMRILNWMPRRCRYDPENPPNFTLSMNILLAFVRSWAN